jgi:hypothetical protein
MLESPQLMNDNKGHILTVLGTAYQSYDTMGLSVADPPIPVFP